MKPKDLQPPNFICTINFSGSQDFQCHRSHNYTASNLVINTCINTYLLGNKVNKSTEADKYLLSWTVIHKIIKQCYYECVNGEVSLLLIFLITMTKTKLKTTKQKNLMGKRFVLSEFRGYNP